MALQGRFILDDAEYSPLVFPGVGTFLAFSGNGQYRNHGGCAAVPTQGPIPAGKYWIVQRGEGGFWSKKMAASKDWFNREFRGAEFTHSQWFALYRDDMSIDDYTWINGVRRGNFRLHPGKISEGCITLVHNSDFAVLRNELLRTPPVQVPCMRSLMARGYIEVTANGKTCP